MNTAIVWFRRDLRLEDNPALTQALEQSDCVVPVYIWAPGEEAPWAPGAASRWWLHHSLAALADALERLGAPLILRRGDSLETLRTLIADTGARAVYWNRLYEPAAIRRDGAVKKALTDQGIEARSFNAALLYEPWSIANDSALPYRVFTPYWRRCLSELPARPDGPPPPWRQRCVLPSEPLSRLALRPQIPWDREFPSHWTPGEAGARDALDEFRQHAIGAYASRRDVLAADGVSRLSPHLHFGEIGPRQIAAAIADVPERDAYLRQLGWREFAHHLLYHFPHTSEQPLDARFARFPWRDEASHADDLQAWQRGRTGIAVVDAAMLELWRSGWMHNRARMISASFLCKNLLIPWQSGARWFWDCLVDADLANNTLGWQWVAGCGADAAPFFRIFNPERQADKFDADGAYVRRWRRGGARAPIVDLAATRARALSAYDTIKRRDG